MWPALDLYQLNTVDPDRWRPPDRRYIPRLKKTSTCSERGAGVSSDTPIRHATESAMAGMTGSTPVCAPRPLNSQIKVVATPVTIEDTAPGAVARFQVRAATSEGVMPVP